MAMHRFYCPELRPGALELEGPEAEHARRSLRLRIGEEAELFDGRGRVARGKVTELDGRVVRLATLEVSQAEPPALRIDLAAALPKGDRGEMVVEKATELGVDRFIPLLTRRSVVDPRPGKLERYERIAVEAAKQSGRLWLPQISPPCELAKVMGDPEYGLKLLADAPAKAAGEAGQAEQAARSPIGAQWVMGAQAAGRMPATGRVLVMIGPEGGWEDGERAAAAQAGCLFWRFGPHTLRVETAALAAMAILRCQE